MFQHRPTHLFCSQNSTTRKTVINLKKNALQVASLTLLCLSILACTPKNAGPSHPQEPKTFSNMGKPVATPADTTDTAEETLEELTVTPPKYTPPADTLPVYRATATSEFDLIHTKIQIAFDWEKNRANATTTITLRPWFYETDMLTLDAKNFDIKKVNFEGDSKQLEYSYDNEQIRIKLGRKFKRSEEFKVAIQYTAKPDERAKIGGSDAIRQDKGLYFIKPDSANPTKPYQIWTQGETESNSFWFPTIDKPNQRCTQEMEITVADKYVTLSNGVMTGTKRNADGSRTDFWRMDKPHAPYLFMMAVGEYAVVKDKWRGIDVNYYVEPKFESVARDIFPYTPDMLEMFSQKLGYNYPWPKYSQVVVRDYVSGAMENTSAVIFGEFMQAEKRELADQHLMNESIVAHEMFHHWFGDLVTCESWSNLTLNEGFANYSEYLWIEHKYGRLAADEYARGERNGYFGDAEDGAHPLIHFGYDSREDMFDGHSYNKGGAILHMLRTQVGDEAFFAALQQYLKKNEFTDAEAHELRLAFEDLTGQDLNWFFNQWFFANGHPVLDINYDYDEARKKAIVTIEQMQKPEDGVPNVFDLPLAVDVYDADGKARREQIRVNRRKQSFEFDAATKPAFVNVDATKTLLALKTDNHTTDEWAFIYKHGPLFMDRWEALEALEESEEAAVALPVFAAAVNDKSNGILVKALQMINEETGLHKDSVAVAKAAELAATHPEAKVRAAAQRALGAAGDKRYQAIVEGGLTSEQPYSVVGAALGALMKIDKPAALRYAKQYEALDKEALLPIIARVYASNPDTAHLAFFDKNFYKAEGGNAVAFYSSYQRMISTLGDVAIMDKGFERLRAMGLDPKAQDWRRFGSVRALYEAFMYFKRVKRDDVRAEALRKMVVEIKEAEKDEEMKRYYQMFKTDMP